MLQSAYFLAKIGADTAENERTFAEIFARHHLELEWSRSAPAARGAAVELAQQYTAALRQTQRTAHLTVQISAKE